MASLAQERSPFYWCISTVTVPPAGTLHFEAAGPWFALQRMSLLATEVTGLFPFGSLAHVDWYRGVSNEEYAMKVTYLVHAIDPKILKCCVRDNLRREGSNTG